MKIEKQITVNKSIGGAWEVLRDFANAHVWASPLTHSEGKGGNFNGCECSERISDIKGTGIIREKLIRFSDDEHLLSYVVEEGMPKMVKNATNTWWLTSLEQSKSELNINTQYLKAGTTTDLNVTFENNLWKGTVDVELQDPSPLIVQGESSWTFYNISEDEVIVFPLTIFTPISTMGATGAAVFSVSFNDQHGTNYLEFLSIGLIITGVIKVSVFIQIVSK